MKQFILKMLSTNGDVSLMRCMVALTITTACGIAIGNIFVQKDMTAMVIGMLTAAGVSKAAQSFGEKK